MAPSSSLLHGQLPTPYSTKLQPYVTRLQPRVPRLQLYVQTPRLQPRVLRYDGTFFAANLSSNGAYAVGQMRLYDVGFASMVAMEAEALAELAPLVGRADAVARLKARAATQRRLISAHLWDKQGGTS